MGFDVIVHEADDLLEFVYPEDPTAADVVAYAARVRTVVGARKKPWSCLVDQRKLRVIPPELLAKLAELNTFAAANGMQRAARVVVTAVAALQATRLVREAAVTVPVRTFGTREEAYAWLKESARR